MPHFDLVIIGAGPAGTAAAVTGRRAGLTVALIDKARFPRTKLCGGLITGRCARHLQDVFDLPATPPLMETRRRFAFYMDGQPLGNVEDAPPLHLTMRWDFDQRLFDRALAAGAADFTGQRVQKLDLDNNTLTLTSQEQLSWSILIGADGVQSSVAKALFGQSFDPARIGFALEIEAAPCGPDETTPVRIDFGAAQWGYGWSFPKRASTTVGLGGLHARNDDMKSHLATYLDMLKIDQSAKIKGHFLPFGDYRRTPGRGNVLLVGDAAGFVDPITGEGIGHAIHSGALAARAATAAIKAGQPKRATALYRSATAPIRTAISCARALRPLIFEERLKPLFSSAFTTSRTLKYDYLRLLAGAVEYPRLLTQTITRLPGACLRWVSGPRRGRNRSASSD